MKFSDPPATPIGKQTFFSFNGRFEIIEQVIQQFRVACQGLELDFFNPIVLDFSYHKFDYES